MAQQAGPAKPSPDQVEFLWVSMEGIDPYSWVGGLATRVVGLTEELAARGFSVRCLFCGDPHGPEESVQGHRIWQRWGQAISRRYPSGVYEGEAEKAAYLRQWLPAAVVRRAREAHALGRRLVVVAEEWQTAAALVEASDALWRAGLRAAATLMWNANNVYGFDRIDWSRLAYVAHLTTVSRYMRGRLPAAAPVTVIPNGLAAGSYRCAPEATVARLREAFPADLRLFKVGRYDADKRWELALETVARLRRAGTEARLLVRGGHGPEAESVRQRAASLGLAWARCAAGGIDGLTEALARRREPVVEIASWISEDTLRALYRAADAVLAFSAMEPFGLVGLEVMAQGGVVLTGNTGEDYAVPFQNALVVDSDQADEVVALLGWLATDAQLVRRLRREGRRTAARYAWKRQADGFLYRVGQFAGAGK